MSLCPLMTQGGHPDDLAFGKTAAGQRSWCGKLTGNSDASKSSIRYRLMAIPKLIHQTLRNTIDLNPILAANIFKLKQLNPNWAHRFYDNNDQRMFISKFYGAEVLKSFDKINAQYGAARADFFRYLLVYELGGVYLDIKSTANKALDDVLRNDDAFILSQWANKAGEPYENWGKHPEFGISLSINSGILYLVLATLS